MKITYDEYKKYWEPDYNKQLTPEIKDEPFALKLKDGTRVPGATTIVNQLDKPYLVKWANKLGKEGVDVTEYVNNSAKLGTLIHSMIEACVEDKVFVRDETVNDEQFLIANQILLDNFMPWYNSHQFEFIFCEKPYVSEEYKFGGFIDCYCKLDGKYTVVDFKTSKEITEEQIVQVCSYVKLLEENNLPVDQVLILNVKKELNSKIQEKYLQVNEIEPYWNLFGWLLGVYYAKKAIPSKKAEKKIV